MKKRAFFSPGSSSPAAFLSSFFSPVAWWPAKICRFIFCALLALSLGSCGTILGGQRTEHQKSAPLCDQPRRQIRAGVLIFDLLLFPPGAAIDFATGAIYKKLPNDRRLKHCRDGSEKEKK